MKKILISGIACSILILSSGCAKKVPVCENEILQDNRVSIENRANNSTNTMYLKNSKSNEDGIGDIEHIKQAITILIKKMKILEEQKRLAVPVVSTDSNINSEINILDEKIGKLKILMDKEFEKCEKCCDIKNVAPTIENTPSQYDNIIKDFIEDGTLK